MYGTLERMFRGTAHSSDAWLETVARRTKEEAGTERIAPAAAAASVLAHLCYPHRPRTYMPPMQEQMTVA